MKRLLFISIIIFNIVSAQGQALPSDTASINTANIYFAKGDYETGIKYCEKALDRNPNDTKALKKIGLAYISIGNNDSAATPYFQKVVKLQRLDTLANYFLGVIYSNFAKKSTNFKDRQDFQTTSNDYLHLADENGSQFAHLKLYTVESNIPRLDSLSINLISVHAMSSNQYLSLFCGYPDYKVSGDMQMYIQTKLSCKTYGEGTYKILKDSIVCNTLHYKNNTPNSTHKPIDLVTYVDKKGTVIKMIVKGDYIDITKLFIFYWPTNVSLASIKNKKVAISHFLTDVITYQVTTPSLAQVTITRN